jgi:hypothetical protein
MLKEQQKKREELKNTRLPLYIFIVCWKDVSYQQILSCVNHVSELPILEI